MKITYLQHASLQLKSRRTSLVVDPYYFLSPLEASISRFYPPHAVTADSLGPLDYVYCSHIHADHAHPRTLTRLKPQIRTLLLPAEKPALERLARALGFGDVVLLQDGVRTHLHERLAVTSHAHDNDVDTALVVEMDGTTVLHANDCVLSRAQMEHIRATTPVDYAFLPHSAVQDLYPLILPRPLAEQRALATTAELEQQGYLVDSAAALRPRVVVPYSYTVTYLNEDQRDFNSVGRTMPHQFVEAVRAQVPDQVCWVMAPGDVIDSRAGTVRLKSDNPYGRTVEEFRRRVDAFANSEAGQCTRVDFGDAQECDSLLQHHFRKERLWWKPLPALRGEVVGIHVLGEHNRRSHYFDFGTRTLSAEPPRPPQLEITVPAPYLAVILRKEEDAYMGLYTRRIQFKMAGAPLHNARLEATFYEQAFVFLFG